MSTAKAPSPPARASSRCGSNAASNGPVASSSWWSGNAWRTTPKGFRGSAAYEEWRAALHHFYDPFPLVEHFEAVVTA